jgi:hypothetical protein
MPGSWLFREDRSLTVAAQKDAAVVDAASEQRVVAIRGDGVAAYCCAHLLTQAGFAVHLEPVNRTRLPAILLGDQALALIRDIFDRPRLFDDAPRIRKRVVAWGAEPREMVHSAVLVSEEMLLRSIRPGISVNNTAHAGQWAILGTRPLPSPAVEHCFGSRMVSAVPVRLEAACDPETCWIESLDAGWLFLTPGWLLAVGGPVEALLGESKLVAAQMADYGAPAGEFPAYARITSPLGAAGWLACGTAAMAFDPICGDGTAQAVREAILASAVIRAIAAGGPSDELLSHYEARLTAGFERHLALCRQFYLSGGNGPMWQSELAAIDRGIAWCKAALASHGGFRYQLRGFELEAVR